MRDAELADMVISFRPGEVHSWIVSSAIEVLGRRHVLRVPDEPESGVSGVIPDWWSNKLFDGKVTSREMDRRLAGGATIEIVSTPLAEGTTLLAAVSSHGRVDFEPRAGATKTTDTLIGLVDRGEGEDRPTQQG